MSAMASYVTSIRDTAPYEVAFIILDPCSLTPEELEADMPKIVEAIRRRHADSLARQAQDGRAAA